MMPARANAGAAAAAARRGSVIDPSDGEGQAGEGARSQSVFGSASGAAPAAPAPAAAAHAPEKVRKYMICQKCRRPFKLVPTCKLTRPSDSSFQWVEDTGSAEMTPDKALEIAAALYQYTSDKANVDMPLCRECTESVGWGSGGIADQYNAAKKDEQAYTASLQVLEEDGMGVCEMYGVSTAAEEVERMKQEEEQLQAQLQAVLAEDERISGELRETEEEAEALRGEVDRFWSDVSDLTVSERSLGDVLDHLKRKSLLSAEELHKVRETNLLNEAFHIWYSGHFGTINTFRLGRLASQMVEPSELNAAWGLAAQLLSTLLSMWGLDTTRYKVLPKGSFSTVIKLGSKSSQVLELWSGARGVWASTRHDNAMTGFACCLDELCKHCLMMCPHDTIPYPMDEDRINGFSVKLSAQGQTDEKWTRALKFLLLNLKWVVTMTSTHME